MSDRVLEIAQAAFADARAGDAAGLEVALDLGLPPGARNQRGDSLLMLASYHGHADATRLLLARGADPEAPNDRGQTALAGAAFQGDAAMVALLLAGGARVDGAGPDGRTALHYAAMFDRLESIELLLAGGADPERRDAQGARPADLARGMGAARAVGRLDAVAPAAGSLRD